MKTSVALCFLIVALCSQSISAEYTLAEFESHLDFSQDTFVNDVENDPPAALGTAVQALAQAMGIATQLVADGVITNDRAVELLIGTFRDGLEMTLHVPMIHGWTQYVCKRGGFPFPDAVSSMFPKFTNGMNAELPTICRDFGMTYGGA